MLVRNNVGGGGGGGGLGSVKNGEEWIINSHDYL